MFIGCAFTPPITGLIAKYILTESRQFAHYTSSIRSPFLGLALLGSPIPRREVVSLAF